MARLAFIAVLLMAFAPAISRWVRSDSVELLPGLTELCTTAGLKYVDVSVQGDAAKSPASEHFDMGMDCAYCPLLAATALLLLSLALLSPQALANLIPHAPPRPSGSSGFFPELGSRGPPLAL